MLLSSWMSHNVVWHKFIDIPGNLLSGSFKSSGMLRCVVGLVVFRVFGPVDEGTAMLRNVEHYSPKITASHRRSL